MYNFIKCWDIGILKIKLSTKGTSTVASVYNKTPETCLFKKIEVSRFVVQRDICEVCVMWYDRIQTAGHEYTEF